ncbi:helix-turn-helix domain-containing protein [Streptomyces sp. NPDC002324]
MVNQMTKFPSTTQLGELLQQYRRRCGFTQSELSGFSTVSVRAIRNLELGQARNPRRETIRLLADALRLGDEQLVAFQLAAGQRVYDIAFERLPALLPAATRPLRGRNVELARILRAYRTERQRLVAITGLGGVGKSRLALETALVLRAEDGLAVLWWTLPDPGGSDERARGHCQPPLVGLDNLLSTHGGAVDDAVRLIGERQVLLVLDGNDMDQITPQSLEKLLDGCRNLLVLQTSRTAGEARWPGFRLPLHPLPVPGADTGEHPSADGAGPAVAVLLDRLADLQVGFGTDWSDRIEPEILEICARLDGLPRALEAAASWLVTSSAADLVQLARSEPHMIAQAADAESRETSWVDQALVHALATLTPQQKALLVDLAGWGPAWTVQQFADGLEVGCLEAAVAVHAYLRCGLIRRMPSAQQPVFVVMQVMRAPIRALSDRLGRTRIGLLESDMGGNHDDSPDSYRPARRFGTAASLLRSGTRRDDAA